MSETDLTFVNAALTRVGENRLTSLIDANHIASAITEANYELVVKDELSRYPWRWATTTVTLGGILAEGSETSPWSYARTLPLPIIRVMSVRYEGQAVPFEIRSSTIYTDYDDDYDILITAVWRQIETYWPPAFGELITLRMQQIFLRALGERYSEADSLEGPIKKQRADARLQDSQVHGARTGVTSPILTARYA
jgi:hypothetical protein